MYSAFDSFLKVVVWFAWLYSEEVNKQFFVMICHKFNQICTKKSFILFSGFKKKIEIFHFSHSKISCKLCKNRVGSLDAGF